MTNNNDNRYLLENFWSYIKASQLHGTEICFGRTVGRKHRLWVRGLRNYLELSKARLNKIKSLEELTEYVETEIAIAKVKGIV